MKDGSFMQFVYNLMVVIVYLAVLFFGIAMTVWTAIQTFNWIF